MHILTIKTNEPTAEVSLHQDNKQLAHIAWQGHRQLSVTIHEKIEELLKKQNKKYGDLEGIAFFAGPGSFTGLRIGATVASALSYSLQIPVVSAKGKDWQTWAVTELKNGADDKTAKPFYGKEPRITKPRK
jgi:tRNA threonylcarbamoyladenosine biosynthesis protein TsaB